MLAAAGGQGQTIEPSRGVDSRVDYVSLVRFGPWDDRNYQVTQEDLERFADNEAELSEAIPAFYRARLRQQQPALLDSGPCQYPRSSLPKFLIEFGGYLIDGKLYRAVHRDQDGRFVVDMIDGINQEDFPGKALIGEVMVTEGAESAVAINPSNPDRVISGANGMYGQVMNYSSDGGTSWQQAASLPYGGTCCDPAVDWSSDGSKAYATTLGWSGGVYFYRSADNGQTWGDLLVDTPGDARREMGGAGSDKEYVHVDQFPTSPYVDNLYITWHDNNTMKLARSDDFGNSWISSTISSGASQQGIGSDITTGSNGHVHYIWPAMNASNILVRTSTDGGVNFQSAVVIAATQASFDFPVPSMDTRRVFVYVAADADLTSGPFGGSIYASWTDSTGPTTANPANNHARIQVAYSRDGGATWNVSTPHETADQNSVDRWHQWLAVGEDGTVHVAFYDTRRDPTRTSVDLFYTYSSDGAQTFSAPIRLTSEQSPAINDGFEFGDYNGLDVVMSQVIAIFTDNRHEGGGTGDSVDIYAAAPDSDSSIIFSDGFESGDLQAWSSASP